MLPCHELLKPEQARMSVAIVQVLLLYISWRDSRRIQCCLMETDGVLCVLQVGNYTADRTRWDRPENMKDKRPVYYVPTKNGVLFSIFNSQLMCVYVFFHPVP
jgi:hypothetical protein